MICAFRRGPGAAGKAQRRGMLGIFRGGWTQPAVVGSGETHGGAASVRGDLAVNDANDERGFFLALSKLSAPLRLQGNSMMPWVWPGTRVSVVACRPEELRKGDVAVVALTGALRVHRVISRDPGAGWILRGDALAKCDPKHYSTRIVARVPGTVLFRWHWPTAPPALGWAVNRAILFSTRASRPIYRRLRRIRARAEGLEREVLACRNTTRIKRLVSRGTAVRAAAKDSAGAEHRW